MRICRKGRSGLGLRIFPEATGLFHPSAAALFFSGARFLCLQKYFQKFVGGVLAK